MSMGVEGEDGQAQEFAGASYDWGRRRVMYLQDCRQRLCDAPGAAATPPLPFLVTPPPGTVSYEYHADGWDPQLWGRVVAGSSLGYDEDVDCANPGDGKVGTGVEGRGGCAALGTHRRLLRAAPCSAAGTASPTASTRAPVSTRSAPTHLTACCYPPRAAYLPHVPPLLLPSPCSWH